MAAIQELSMDINIQTDNTQITKLEKFGGSVEVDPNLNFILNGLPTLETDAHELEALGTDRNLGLLVEAFISGKKIFEEKIKQAYLSFLSARELRWMFGKPKPEFALAHVVAANLLKNESDAKEISINVAEKAQKKLMSITRAFIEIHAFLVQQNELAKKDQKEHMEGKQAMDEIHHESGGFLARFINTGKRIINGSLQEINSKAAKSQKMLDDFERLIPNINVFKNQSMILATQSADLDDYNSAKAL